LKYAYFPGCSIHTTAKEYGISSKAVSKVLGIELVEIPEWNCCGAMDAVYAYNPLLSISLSARNLALAESMKMDVVTLCSACFFTLSRAHKLLREDSELKGKVDKLLNESGLQYTGEVRVRHFLDVLIRDVGLENIAKNVKVKLDGLKVAPYYGCMLIRPPNIVHFDDPEHPKSMELIIEAIGGKNVDYIYKTRCCGASLGLTDGEVMMEMTKDLLLEAKNANADCIALPCPLCHLNMDAKQKSIESTFDIKIGMPIVFFTQLMGMAFGLNPKELALNKNCVPTGKLFKQIHD